MEAVDRASDRVITGSLGQRSWQSRELRYAIVGSPGRLEPAALRQIKAAAQTLRDPQTSTRPRPRDRRARSRRSSGSRQRARRRGERHRRRAAGALRARRPRATAPRGGSSTTRSSCSCPTQNPDGREADTRRNAYGFDMNRDWFARTQPETDGKLELLRAVPAAALHRRARDGRHELLLPAERRPDLPRDHRRVGRLDQRPLRRRDGRRVRPPGHRRTSTATSTTSSTWATATPCRPPAFIAAGMTFEKGGATRSSGRAYEQYLTPVGVAVPAAAQQAARSSPSGTRATSRPTQRAARASSSRTSSCNPGNELEQPGARHAGAPYFIARRRGDKAAEVQALVRRLQRMDVEVVPADARRCDVPDYTPYGRARRDRATLPAGTLLDPDGAGAEALGPGDAERGHLHPVPVLLRRHRVEPAAAVQRSTAATPGRRSTSTRAASVALDAAAARSCRPTQPRIARVSMSPSSTARRSSRAAGCATCSTGSGRSTTTTSPPARSLAAPSIAATSSWCPTGPRTWVSPISARQGVRQFAAGSITAVIWSPGVEAPSSRPSSA